MLNLIFCCFLESMSKMTCIYDSFLLSFTQRMSKINHTTDVRNKSILNSKISIIHMCHTVITYNICSPKYLTYAFQSNLVFVFCADYQCFVNIYQFKFQVIENNSCYIVKFISVLFQTSDIL